MAISTFNFSSHSGGKDAITRLLQAYGFSTRQALCEHLGVSQSTMANRWMRDTFPHDWLIACHLDTGASLLWLATGKGNPGVENAPGNGLRLQYKEVTNGIISNPTVVHYDSLLIPKNTTNLSLVKFEGDVYLVEEYKGEVNDGVWFIEIDGFSSIRRIYRLPGSRLRVENGPASFECEASGILVLGKIVGKTTFTE